MSKKFHVGPNGASECKATVKRCPLGESNHYSSLKEADASFASQMEEKYSPTMSKRPSTLDKSKVYGEELERLATEFNSKPNLTLGERRQLDREYYTYQILSATSKINAIEEKLSKKRFLRSTLERELETERKNVSLLIGETLPSWASKASARVIRSAIVEDGKYRESEITQTIAKELSDEKINDYWDNAERPEDYPGAKTGYGGGERVVTLQKPHPTGGWSVCHDGIASREYTNAKGQLHNLSGPAITEVENTPDVYYINGQQVEKTDSRLRLR